MPEFLSGLTLADALIAFLQGGLALLAAASLWLGASELLRALRGRRRGRDLDDALPPRL